MATAESIIRGASKHIDLLLPLPVNVENNSPAHVMRDLFALADRRLHFRFLVSTELTPQQLWANPQILMGTITSRAVAWYALDEFEENSEYKYTTHPSELGLAVVDDAAVVVVDTPQGNDHPRVYSSESPDEVSAIKEHFQHLWDTPARNQSLTKVIYEDLLKSSFPDVSSKTASVSFKKWDRLLHQLKGDPNQLYNLTPREFEELIAHLLEGKGYSVSLTQQSRDGGKDILIATPTELGDLLYLVECKKYDPKRPVGVSLVRELFGVVEHERATAGLLVTSSYFTPDALKFREPIKHRIALHDYIKVIEWINNSMKRRDKA